MKIENLDVKNYIKESLIDINFKETTEIQDKVIPFILDSKDIIVQANTGTGKTHSFLIPIFNKLDELDKSTQFIIITPTRELANQIFKFANLISNHSDNKITIRKYIGGNDRNKELSKLKTTTPQIIIGTPGKLFDLLIKEKSIDLSGLKGLILDEFDMCLENGFLEDIDKILSNIKQKINVMLFSATYPNQMALFVKKYFNSPINIIHKSVNDKLKHILINNRHKNEYDVLFNVLDNISPYFMIIFANTKTKVEDIYNKLKAKKLNVGMLSGDLKQRERNRVLKRINLNEFQYLVSSDIGSRGIDIDGVTHILNFELPNDFEFYVHRSGRTARSNYEGICYSLYNKIDNNYINSLETKGIKFEYLKFENNQLVPDKEVNSRKKRVKQFSLEKQEVLKKFKKPKVVKPGYKKKYNEKINNEVKRMKRGK